MKDNIKTCLGIDLSTKEIGVVISSQRVGFWEIHWHQISTPKIDDWYKQSQEIGKEIIKWLDWVENLKKDCPVYIEVGNFGSPLMTQKFAYLAGVLTTMFAQEGYKEVRLIRPQDWFIQFIKSDLGLDMDIPRGRLTPREDRKKIITDAFTKELEATDCYVGSKMTQDIADAYFIAKHGEKCPHIYWDKKQINKFKGVKSGKKTRKKNKR